MTPARARRKPGSCLCTNPRVRPAVFRQPPIAMLADNRLPKLSIIALFAAAAFNPAGAAAQAVQFDFAWTPGLVGQVSTSSESAMESMAGELTETTAFSFEMAVENHASGLSITTRDFDFGVPEPTTPGDRLAQMMQSRRPVLLVSQAGEFVGLEGVEEITALTRTMLDSMAAEAGAPSEAVFGGFDGDFWRSQATSDWNTKVGLWVGREFEVGEVVSVGGAQRFPMFGSEPLPVTWQLEYRGPIACNDSDTGTGCVTLVVRSEPDGIAMAEAMRGFMADMLGEMGPAAMQITFEIDEVSVDSETVMIVEPGTLLPHSVVADMTTRSVMSMMGMSQSSSNRIREETVYTWNR